MNKLALLTLLALLPLSACAPSEGPIVYAQVPDTFSDTGVHDLTLDITTPDPDTQGAGPFPAIVWIHGGGWRFGNLYDGFGRDILEHGPKRGYVAVSINYRLTLDEDDSGDPRFPWPAQIQDTRCALRWLSDHAADYGIDTHRIGLAGYSGGGHLALLTTEAPEHERWDGDFCNNKGPIQVAATFSRSGPSDLSALWPETGDLGREWAGYALNVSPDADVSAIRGVLDEASPLTYVDSLDSTPLYLNQGLDDEMVPADTQGAFLEAVRAAGQPVEVLEFENQGHSWGGDESTHSIEEMYRFFERELQGGSPEMSCSPWPSCEG